MCRCGPEDMRNSSSSDQGSVQEPITPPPLIV
eukprot:CAMPEP_0118924744 /NCGR_PEP_ID=MMETSP1169-20130426/2736_1 /TAXON_ID=36882 /ORGANISM="Pyramimonas obovata, Strain CCMP722" /LENGTH=31 /DNA_ID= /DNA_START= /DNA_END= /DNA_ORIENTATION=